MKFTTVWPQPLDFSQIPNDWHWTIDGEFDSVLEAQAYINKLCAGIGSKNPRPDDEQLRDLMHRAAFVTPKLDWCKFTWKESKGDAEATPMKPPVYRRCGKVDCKEHV